MSEQGDPTKPTSNDEKFKPQNVQDAGAGNPGGPGRADRNMKDLPRGSEDETRRIAQNRTD